ncbi:MAG TPA: hypothetical protein VGG33_03740 [Polyangia bacterium]
MKKLSKLSIVLAGTVAGFVTVAAGAGVSSAQDDKAKPAPAKAAAPAASEGGEYKAKTVYDFDDDTVEGDLQRPDGELIDSVRKVKHSSLIEIRKDFIPEMLKSLEDV